MTQKFTVEYCISDDGWVYTDSFGLIQLEGRTGQDVGVQLIDGVRTLCIPEEVDDAQVYIIAFHGFEQGFEALYVPDGVGIIAPHAFAGCGELKTVRVPDDMYDISDTAFLGTAIPENRQQELHAMGRMKREIAEEACTPGPEEASARERYRRSHERPDGSEPGNGIPF